MTSLAIPPDEVEQMKGLAELLPGEPPELFAKMIFGRGLGMGPAQSLSQIDFVKGKCELTANAQASRMRAYVGPWGERYDYEVAALTNEVCTLRFWRRWTDRDDERLGESTFSIEDAKTAGIASGMYSKYPRNMLLSRAMSNGVAWFAPETTYGVRVFSPGEIDPSRDHRVPELTVEARAALAEPPATPAAAAQLEAAPAEDGAARPSRELFAEFRALCNELGVADDAIHVLADDAHVPSGESLKERFRRATAAQVQHMIDNVEFVDTESPDGGDPEGDGQQTIDGSVAPETGPQEGVMA